MPKVDFPGSKVSPSLLRWCSEPTPGERSVIVRVLSTVEPSKAADELRQAGAEIESEGRGVITAIVNPTALEQLCRQSWVLAVEEPRSFSLNLQKLR
jgi:hypothetical protein